LDKDIEAPTSNENTPLGCLKITKKQAHTRFPQKLSKLIFYFGLIAAQPFENVWKEGKIPQDWKDGHLIKLPKRGDLSNCGNYRGITLLSI